jgi:hypothetical protein
MPYAPSGSKGNKPTNQTNQVNILTVTPNSMELSNSSEVNRCSSTQEIPNSLWNLKIHYRVHKGQHLVPSLSQTNPVHVLQQYFFQIIFISTFQLCPCLHIAIFPLGFSIKSLHAFLFYPMHATCPVHLTRLDLIILSIFDKYYQLWSSSSCNFFPASCYFIPFRSKYSHQHPILKHPQPILFPCWDWSLYSIIQIHTDKHK